MQAGVVVRLDLVGCAAHDDERHDQRCRTRRSCRRRRVCSSRQANCQTRLHRSLDLTLMPLGATCSASFGTSSLPRYFGDSRRNTSGTGNLSVSSSCWYVIPGDRGLGRLHLVCHRRCVPSTPSSGGPSRGCYLRVTLASSALTNGHSKPYRGAVLDAIDVIHDPSTARSLRLGDRRPRLGRVRRTVRSRRDHRLPRGHRARAARGTRRDRRAGSVPASGNTRPPTTSPTSSSTRPPTRPAGSTSAASSSPRSHATPQVPKRLYGGDYHDVVVKTPDGWRFAHKHCLPRWQLAVQIDESAPDHRLTY